MKNSWFINICIAAIILLITSCVTKSVINSSEKETYNGHIKSPFFDKDSVCFFKASIYTYGKSLSGILAIKKQHTDTLKVSFFTEMGVKFFDVLIFHDSYLIVDCIPQLNSRVIMETLTEDIRWVVLWNLNDLSQPLQISSPKKELLVQYFYKGNWIIGKMSSNDFPDKITYAYGKKKIPKFDVTFNEYYDCIPRKIAVKHHKFDLRIHLSYISFAN